MGAYSETESGERSSGTQSSESYDGESWESSQGGWEGRGSQDPSEQGWDDDEEQSEGGISVEQQELFKELERVNEESNEQEGT